MTLMAVLSSIILFLSFFVPIQLFYFYFFTSLLFKIYHDAISFTLWWRPSTGLPLGPLVQSVIFITSPLCLCPVLDHIKVPPLPLLHFCGSWSTVVAFQKWIQERRIHTLNVYQHLYLLTRWLICLLGQNKIFFRSGRYCCVACHLPALLFEG